MHGDLRAELIKPLPDTRSEAYKMKSEAGIGYLICSVSHHTISDPPDKMQTLALVWPFVLSPVPDAISSSKTIFYFVGQTVPTLYPLWHIK